jgi:hypothetical protein
MVKENFIIKQHSRTLGQVPIILVVIKIRKQEIEQKPNILRALGLEF